MNTKTTITVDISDEAGVRKIIEELEILNREWRRQKHAADLAADTSPRDVHTGHCCVRCGCKYGYDIEELRKEMGEKECTVRNGTKIQEYFELECCTYDGSY
jgi:hypothetical protein